MSEEKAKSQSESTTSRVKVYPSAVDLWVPVLLLMTPIVAVIVGVLLLRQDRAGDAITLFLLGVGFLLLAGMFTVPCRYTILEDTLSIRCGILCYQVPLSEIESVQRSVSLRSGPALSMRRVLITTKQRGYLISPQDRDGFIADLEKAKS